MIITPSAPVCKAAAKAARPTPAPRLGVRTQAQRSEAAAPAERGASAQHAEAILPPARDTQRVFSRRDLAGASTALLASIALAQPQEARAVQGLIAGRIPGLSPEPDGEGFFTYSRPEAKSGGHGVGWSEIPSYRFKVPATWEERPVSIADLGGTEIDLRFTSRDQGELAVVVAPVLRFADIGFNASVKIEELGTPEKIIKGFAPELFGVPLEDEDILETRVRQKPGFGTSYYEWLVKPHRLVSATAVGNRVFIISVVASARQWRRFEPELRSIASSFVVPSA